MEEETIITPPGQDPPLPAPVIEPAPAPTISPVVDPVPSKYDAAADAALSGVGEVEPYSKYEIAVDQAIGQQRFIDEARRRAAAKFDADQFAKTKAQADAIGSNYWFAMEHQDAVKEVERIRAMAPPGSLAHHPELEHWLTNPDNAAIANDEHGTLKTMSALLNATLQRKAGWAIPDYSGMLMPGFIFDSNGKISTVQAMKHGGWNTTAVGDGSIDAYEQELRRRGFNAEADEANRIATEKRLLGALGMSEDVSGWNPWLHIATGAAQSLVGWQKLAGQSSSEEGTMALGAVSERVAPGTFGGFFRLTGMMAGDLPLLLTGTELASVATGAARAGYWSTMASGARSAEKAAQLAMKSPEAFYHAAQASRYAWQAQAAESLSAISKARALLSPVMGARAAEWAGKGLTGATAAAPMMAKMETGTYETQGAAAALAEFAGNMGVMVATGPFGLAKALVGAEKALAPTASGLVGSLAKHSAVGAVQMGLMPWITAVSQAALGRTDVDWSRVPEEAMRSAEVGGLASLVFGMAPVWREQHMRQLEAGAMSLNFGNALFQADQVLRTSPLQKRSAQAMESAIAEMTKGAPQTVYLQSKAWQEHWIGQGKDPVAMAEAAGVKAEFTEAQATGSDMAVPVSKYLQALQSSTKPKELIGQSRQHPKALTPDVGAKLFLETPDKVQAEKERLAEIATKGMAGDPVKEAIKEDFRQQMRLARPNWGEKVLDSVSEIWSRMMVGIARIATPEGGTAIDPMSLHKAISIGGMLPESARARGTDGLKNMIEKIKSGAGVTDAEGEKALADLAEHARAVGVDIAGQTVAGAEAALKTGAVNLYAGKPDTALMQGGVRIVTDAHIPYGAGASRDGKTLYLDKRLPRFLTMADGKVVDLFQSLRVHELAENRNMDLHGMSYDEAHKAANAEEHAFLVEQGVDPKEYEAALKPFLDRARAEHDPEAVPADLHFGQYEGEPGLVEDAKRRAVEGQVTDLVTAPEFQVLDAVLGIDETRKVSADGSGLSAPGVLFQLRAAPDWVEKFLTDPGLIKTFGEENLKKFGRDMLRTAAVYAHLDITPEEIAGNPLRKNMDPKFTRTFDLSTICPQQDQYVAAVSALEFAYHGIFPPEVRQKVGDIMKEAGEATACWYCYGQTGRDLFDWEIVRGSGIINRAITASRAGRLTSKQIEGFFAEAGGTLSTTGKLREMIDSHAKTSKILDPMKVRDLINGLGKEATPEQQQALFDATPQEIEIAKAIRTFAQIASGRNKAKGFSSYVDSFLRVSDQYVAFVNSVGGQRFNSQTDFRAWHIVDLSQAMVHMAERGLGGHVYLKDPNFIRIFGKTGMFFNMSMEAVTRPDGKVEFDHMEGFPPEVALKFRKEYPNAGAMLMAADDAQLSWGLNHPSIDMIIPFHSRRMGKWLVESKGAKDYSNWQSEDWSKHNDTMDKKTVKPIKDGYRIRLNDGSKVDVMLPPDKRGDPIDAKNHPIITQAAHENNAARYKEICAKLGVRPVFDGLVLEDGTVVTQHKNYMRVVRDVAKQGLEQKPVDPMKIDWKAASKVIDGWIKAGGDKTTARPGVVELIRQELNKSGLLDREIPEAQKSYEQPAYHGTGNTSPYSSGQLSYNKVNAEGGEGTQNEGHGVYVTGSPSAARFYREQNAERRPGHRGVDKVILIDGVDTTGMDGNQLANSLLGLKQIPEEKAIALEEAVVDIDLFGYDRAVQRLRPSDIDLKWALDALRGKKIEASKPGRVYTVEIPDDTGGNYLDWDKPMGQQGEEVVAKVKSALATFKPDMAEGEKSEWFKNEFPNWTGEQIYESMSRELGSAKSASDALHAAGIIGNKYLGSEGQGPYHNYVIFQDVPYRSYQQSRTWKYKTEEVLPKLPVKGSSEQVRKTMLNAGVNERELYWLGIDDLLKSKDTVTKDEIAMLLADPKVKVGEVMKDDQTGYELGGWEEVPAVHPTDTKFGNYTLPGGTNYRELLLTLPEVSSEKELKSHIAEQDKLFAYVDALRGKYEIKEDGVNTDDARLSLDEQKKLGAMRLVLTETLFAYEDAKGNIFHSSHWSEPNVLLHTRFNERQTVDGQKVLHIEEIQSDWHQKGREGGYKGDPVDTTGWTAIDTGTKPNPGPLNLWEIKDAKGIVRSSVYAWGEKDALENYRRDIERNADFLVPDAPMRKTWEEVGFKRMLRQAVDQGIDRVTWTTGEQQAERYNLATQVREIVLITKEDGGRLFDVQGVDGEYIVALKDPTDQQIVDTIGKDAASRLTQQSAVERAGGGTVQKLSGEGLKVGGEGMSAAYDKRLVNIANKIGKRFGVKDEMVKVETEKGETAEVHSLQITPEMAAEIREGQTMPLQQRGEESARGSYQPAEGGRLAQILLGPHADPSTPIHELGHYALDLLSEFASKEDAPAQLKKDIQAIMDHIGVKDLEVWRGMDFEARRTAHEKFSDSWETYFLTGKAPVPELKGAFAKIRSLLVDIYKTLKGLVTLSPQITDVFDRLLASKEEIENAKAALGDEPIFKSADEAKMTPDQFAAYLVAAGKATDDATSKLQDEVMAEVARKLTDNYKAEENAVREQITTMVNERPEYKAMLTLQKGEIVGPEGDLVPIKLDRADIVLQHDEEGLRLLPGRSGFSENPNRGKPLYADEGGVSLEAAAAMLGFKDGAELFNALAGSGHRQMAIDKMTAAEMDRRHPDPAKDGTLPDKAEDKIHGGSRGKRLMSELDSLGKRVGQRPAPLEVMRAIARKTIAGKRVRDVSPDLYKSAEAKAIREVMKALADGNDRAAYDAQVRRILNAELYKAASEAKDAIEKAADYTKKFNDQAKREKIGKAGGWEWTVFNSDGTPMLDRATGKPAAFSTEEAAKQFSVLNGNAPYERSSSYLGQIDALREKFVLTRRPIPGRRDSLTAWIADQEGKDASVIIPDWIAQQERNIDWRDLTTEQFADVIDSIKNIEHLAKEQSSLSAKMDKQAFANVRDSLAESVLANAKGKPKRKLAGEETLAGAKKIKNAIIGSLERYGDTLSHLDGFKMGGKAIELLKHPFDNAMNEEARLETESTASLKQLFKEWESAGDRSRLKNAFSKTFIPEIGESLSRTERLMVALNCGNEHNREALRKGFGWDESQVEAVLATLDNADSKLVQGIAKVINSYWSDIAAKQERVTGVAPPKVEGTPFMLAGEVVDGFYFPIIESKDKSSAADARALADIAADARRGAFTAATTWRGFTKARTGVSGKPLSLDINGVARHIHAVVHDLTHHEALRDAARLLRDKKVTAAIEDHYGVATYRSLSNALERIAGASIRDFDNFSTVFRVVTRNISRAGISYNVWTAVQNITGVTQSMERVGPMRFIRAMAPMVGNAEGQQSLRAFVYEKSAMMVRRGKLSGEHAREQTGVGRMAIGRDLPDALRPYAMMEAVQLLVDLPTWKAEYDHAINLGHAEDKAVLMADQAVIDAQSGKDMKDRAAILEGNEFKRALTTFYAYFNSTFNLQRRAILRTEFSDPASVAALARSFFLLYFLPATLSTLGYSLLRPSKKRDEEPMAGRLLQETLGMALGTVPVLRELTAAAKDNPYTGPAGMRGFDAMNRLVVELKQVKADKGLARASADFLGIATGLPTSQMQRTLDGILYDIDQKPSAPEATRAVLFGGRR